MQTSKLEAIYLRFRYLIIFVPVSFCLILFCFFSFIVVMDDPYEWKTEISYDIYSFESKSLLSALDNNEEIEFIEISDPLKNEHLGFEIMSGWELEDYFIIVEQYFDQQIGIKFENWSLHNINADYQ